MDELLRGAVAPCSQVDEAGDVEERADVNRPRRLVAEVGVQVSVGPGGERRVAVEQKRIFCTLQHESALNSTAEQVSRKVGRPRPLVRR